jgi:hypothetical protein
MKTVNLLTVFKMLTSLSPLFKGVVRPTGGYAVMLNWTMSSIYGLKPGEVATILHLYHMVFL